MEAACEPPGTDYTLTQEIADAVPEVYEQLRQLEAAGYTEAPGNLDLALRSFMSSYDSAPLTVAEQIVDLITALESVLGSGTEIAFKLAFRVAAVLGADGEDRARLFRDMKKLYSIRSSIVHGTYQASDYLADLQRVEQLREIVRRILRGMIRIATSDPIPFSRRFASSQRNSTRPFCRKMNVRPSEPR